MRTDVIARRLLGLRFRHPVCVFVRIAAFAILLAGLVRPASAQAPLFLVNPDTRVSSIKLAFPGTTTLDPEAIRLRIGLTAPDMIDRLQGFFDFIPLVRTPAPHPFSPLELGRDAVRIARFYDENGFKEADVQYEVVLDTTSNSVEVTFAIDEGRPLLLDTIDITLVDATARMDSSMAVRWAAFTETMQRQNGTRFGQIERARLRSRPIDWLLTNGFAFATVRDTVAVDSANAAATLRLSIEAGPRARVDSVAISGIESLSYNTVRREIRMRNGDWYSSGAATEGQRQVYGLPLVRLALLDIARDQPIDSTVTLQMRVQEGQRRIVSGELGYATERGAIAQARWEHRDFLGGARSLTLSAVANTGWLAVSDNVNRRFGLSPSLRQPFILDARMSGTISPFVEYRDDDLDESFAVGTDASLLFERGPLKQASATYTISTRRVIYAPSLTLTADRPDTLLLSRLPIKVGSINTSRLGLSLVLGEVDDAVSPRRGFVTHTSIEVAGPPSMSTVQYGRIEASLRGLWPLGRSTGLVGVVSAGRLFPYGESVPDSLAEVLPVLLRLRDAVFTAGGTDDVRGWGNGLVGPKVPDLQLIEQGDSVVASANRYLVLSGLARFTGSLELRLPFPFLGPRHGSHLFLDAGKVWTPDNRFYDLTVPRDPLDQERVFVSAGVGVEFGTLVGPLRIDLGYKLNPSLLDLRDPDAVAKALVAGQPIASVPGERLKRWHLHIAIGPVF